MSGLAGVRWFDEGRPATIADVRPLLARLAHRGPDGLCAASSGPAVMGVAQSITTPEARRERQPLTTESGLTVAFDGRLDNRDELLRALRVPATDGLADIDIVAAAWNSWGPDALPRMLGDFAVAVWDGIDRRLWLARDVFGLRPLLYRTWAGGFWWASELQALARLGEARVNDGMVAEYLADGIRSESETLVRGVLRVPRAGIVSLSASGALQVQRYWTPRVGALRTFRRDEEPVEEFREVFSAAVRARLRAVGPVAITLSGGLDSSLVAVEAARQVRAEDRPEVGTFTLALPGHPSDESPYAQAVAAHVGLPSTVCPIGEPAWQAIVDDAGRALDMPQPPNSVAANPLSDAIRARGIRICLNGVGGNEWFSGYHFPFADLLRQGKWIEMASRMRAFREETSTYRPLSDVRLAMWLQLPERVKQQVRRLMRLPALPAWIQSDFARRVRLVDRLRAGPEELALPTHQLRLMFHSATSAEQMFFTEYTERISAAFGCEERSPFLDRRVVEWALALPDDQRWRHGHGKAVLRRAAASVLPAAIVERGRGPDFSFQTVDGLRHLGGERLLMAIAREREGWVVPDRVAGLWSQMVGQEDARDRGVGYYSWTLWLLVGVHLAARAIEHCRSFSADDGAVVVSDCTIRPRSQKEAV
jgi:asparagine synthase (glutamine-hydrolysing)